MCERGVSQEEGERERGKKKGAEKEGCVLSGERSRKGDPSL